jgi:hypothetical protein
MDNKLIPKDNASSKRTDRVPVWKGKLALGGLLTFGLTAAAGFASKEVREATCLDMPTAADLEYASQQQDATPFALLASSSQKKHLGGRHLRFRARYFGEVEKDVLTNYLDPALVEHNMVLNVRPFEFVDSSGTFGLASQELPRLLVMVPAERAKEIIGLPLGAVVDFTGDSTYQPYSDPKSLIGKSMINANLASPATPDYANFRIGVKGLKVLTPINDPKHRWACRLLHGAK